MPTSSARQRAPQRCLLVVQQAAQEPQQPVDLGSLDVLDHEALGLLDELTEVAAVAGQLLGQRGQRLAAGRVDEDAPDPQQRVVARGARTAPVLGQLLVALEDLLGDDPGVAGGVRQPGEVAAGVGQTVGVVDPQTVERARRHEVDQQGVGGVEHRGVLDAHGGEAW